MAEIGSIRSPGVRGNARAPRPTPGTFGDGVATALQGISRNLESAVVGRDQLANAETYVQEQYKQRRLKTARSSATIELIKLQNDLAREAVEWQQEAPRDPEGYTNSYHTHAKKRVDEFLASVPEDLRDEFNVQGQRLIEQVTTQAFNFELDQQAAAWQTNLTELRQQALDSIQQGEASAAVFQQQFGDLFEDSPLDAEQTYRLREETNMMLEKAELGMELEEVYADPSIGSGTTGGPADGSDVVAAGLPGPARGLLNVIASVESPGYNVLNGGATFSDYSRHPNKLNPETNSTAAGRYQFIYSTWMEAKEALGLPDFSPESQDRAAWWLAQRDFKARTGRELLPALMSKDPELIELVRRTLAGVGKQTTWQGLQDAYGGDPAEFFRYVTGAEGTVPAQIYDDERFGRVPFSERREMWASAEQRFAAQYSDMARNFQVEQGLAIESLVGEIRAGNVTPSDISVFSDQYGLRLEQRDALEAEYTRVNERKLSNASVAAQLEGGAFFDNSVPETRRRQDAFAEDYLLQAMGAEVPEQTITPAVRGFGRVPAPLAQQLGQMAASPNVEVAARAYRVLDHIAQNAPAAYATLDQDLRDNAAAFRRNARLLGQEAALERQQMLRDPAQRQAVDSLRDAAKQERRDNPARYEPARIARRMGFKGELPANTQQIAMFLADYNAAFDHFMILTGGDTNAADELAVERLSTQWGESAFSGDTLTYLPIESHPLVEPFRGSYAWLEEELNADYGSDAFLVPHPRQTAADFAEGAPPTYLVMKPDPNGLPMPVYSDEGRLATFTPSGFEERNRQLIEDTVAKDALHEIDRRAEAQARIVEAIQLQQEIADSGLGSDQDFGADLNEALARLRELEAEREALIEETPVLQDDKRLPLWKQFLDRYDARND